MTSVGKLRHSLRRLTNLTFISVIRLHRNGIYAIFSESKTTTPMTNTTYYEGGFAAAGRRLPAAD